MNSSSVGSFLCVKGLSQQQQDILQLLGYGLFDKYARTCSCSLPPLSMVAYHDGSGSIRKQMEAKVIQKTSHRRDWQGPGTDYRQILNVDNGIADVGRFQLFLHLCQHILHATNLFVLL